MTVDIQIYSGKGMEPVIETLGDFRLRYFCEFPYLYVGTKANEQKHVAEYLANPSARFLVARNDKNIVGVGIGTLLSTERDILEQTSGAFHRNGLNPKEFFYFGEMIFAPEHRNRGIGRLMLDMLKKSGAEQGAKRFCFLAVDRDANDSRRPADYAEFATIFQKLGFQKTSIQVTFDWPTIQPDGSVKITANTLFLWVNKTEMEQLCSNGNTIF